MEKSHGYHGSSHGLIVPPFVPQSHGYHCSSHGYHGWYPRGTLVDPRGGRFCGRLRRPSQVPPLVARARPPSESRDWEGAERTCKGAVVGTCMLGPPPLSESRDWEGAERTCGVRAPWWALACWDWEGAERTALHAKSHLEHRRGGWPVHLELELDSVLSN